MIAPAFGLNRKAAAAALTNADSLATTLLTVCLSAYGVELFGDEEQGIPPMDPIDLWGRLEADFHVKIPLAVENKLNAIMLAVSTDVFFDDPFAFTAICEGLYNGTPPDIVQGFFEQLADTLSMPVIMWAIFEVLMVRDDDLDISPWIKQLIERVFADEAEEDMGELEQAIPYYDRFVESMKSELLDQLQRLGVDRALLTRIRAMDPTPLHDDQGEWQAPTEAPLAGYAG